MEGIANMSISTVYKMSKMILDTQTISVINIKRSCFFTIILIGISLSQTFAGNISYYCKNTLYSLCQIFAV